MLVGLVQLIEPPFPALLAVPPRDLIAVPHLAGNETPVASAMFLQQFSEDVVFLDEERGTY